MNHLVEKLGPVLAGVESPARYLGGEANSVRKDVQSLKGTLALLFPDIYEIGMSHNGTKVLYHCVNREADLLAEICFAPWPDMAAAMRSHDIPLYTHASYTPVCEYDMVGISLQTELNFTNIPYVLELARIPVWSRERTSADPVVVAGGPSMANPEPVADFFDVMVIGDGEELVSQLVRRIGQGRRQGESRDRLLEDLATWKGLYVPSLHQHLQGQGAKGSYLHTQGIQRVWLPELKPEWLPVHNLVPNMGLVHDRFAVEVSRGCTQGCRFCQAGVWYRPARELSPDTVMDTAKQGLRSTGERQLGLLSLSSADYGQIENITDAIIDDAFFDSIDVSLPSLRANSFGQTLAQKVAALKGGRSATFAPETGSERLRHVINKTITDQEMMDAAHHVFSSGFNKIKLYTMIGLPTENLEDMEAFCGLIEQLIQVGKSYRQHFQIAVSVGIFIPKAFTALQWAGFMPLDQTLEHLRYVRERFYRNASVRISWARWETAHLEAIYSRGGRELAPLIMEAYRRGLTFESDQNCVNYEVWQDIWDQFNYDPSWVYEQCDEQTVFPWDFIHAGVSKGYLLSEWRQAHQTDSAPVYDCKWGDCHHCGIPGNGQDISLASPPQVYQAPSRTPEQIRDLVQARQSRGGDVFQYEFEYQKTGLSRFLPHQNSISFFERSLIRLQLPIKYSEGFSPKPRIQNLGALPLGLESYCEIIGIQLWERLTLSGDQYEQLLNEFNTLMPQGMRIHAIRLLSGKFGKERPVAIEYRCPCKTNPSELLQTFSHQKLPTVVNHRGHSVDLNEHILHLMWDSDSNELVWQARCNDQGNTVSPYTLVEGLLDISNDSARQLMLKKTKLIFKSMNG